MFKPKDRTVTWNAISDAAKHGCGLIMLPNKRHVLVDEDVMDDVGHLAWHQISSGYVAKTLCLKGGKKKAMFLHKIVINEEGMVDHKDRNVLNCQRANLRPCTLSQNMANSAKVNVVKTSQYKGVYFEKATNRWRANGALLYKTRNLGRFDSEQEAAQAYNTWASQTFGEFALLNQIPGQLKFH